MTEGSLKRVLLVDDDADIRQIGAMALRRVGGLEVEVCEGGRQALRRARSFEPDLILLDVMMPGMDGPAVAEAFRGTPQCKHVPIVFVTAKAQKHEIARYLDLGALGVIKKPFDPMALADNLRELWARHITEEERSLPDDDDLEELHRRYQRKLRVRADRLDELLRKIPSGRPAECLQEVRWIAHKLAGSGAMFGLPRVSAIGAELEVLALELLANDRRPAREDLEEMQGLVDDLRHELPA
jgi:two-component system, OmpR family, response regulator